MNQVKKYKEKTFEDIKHIDEYRNEYWEARELYPILEYSRWENFINVINKAKVSCENSNNQVLEHFRDITKTIKMPKSAKKEVDDFHFSRYACYLIVQNGDPRKEVIALGQTYFAIQTHKQEISESNYAELSETEKRFHNRKLPKRKNKLLNVAAKNAGVSNFDQFHNAGYRGLYNGENADDIAKRKKLRYREDVLDNMGSSELIANLFRIDQAEQKIVNDKIQGDRNAKKAHYAVGKNVREAIAKNGGTMPEKLLTPNKSLKELEKEKKRLDTKSSIVK